MINTTNYLLRGLLIVSSFLLLTACASAPASVPGNVSSNAPGNVLSGIPSVAIEGESSHEECLGLRKGESVGYSFKTNQYVEFNIHYHGDGGVVYPVELSDTDGHTATLLADAKRRYCFMWVNSDAGPVDLTYKLAIKEPAP